MINPSCQIIRYARERIKLIFRYDPDLVAVIKTIPLYFYDDQQKWWTLPHLESVLEVLAGFLQKQQLVIGVQR